MTQENIYLFVPNIIDYARVVFYAWGFYLMRWQYPWAIGFYAFAVFLDEFDGRAARLLKQESKFGGLLDMLIDRCSMIGIHMVLCQLYPEYANLIQLNAILDVASHWLYTHSALLSAPGSHYKRIGEDAHIFLYLYYTNMTVFNVIVFGSEAFYAQMYIGYFAHHHIAGAGAACVGLWYVAYAVSGLCALGRVVIDVLKFMRACRLVTDVDRAERKKRFSNTSMSKD